MGNFDQLLNIEDLPKEIRQEFDKDRGQKNLEPAQGAKKIK